MKRCTVNFPESSPEASFLEALADSSSTAYQALASLVPGESLESESALLRALVRIAHRVVAETTLTQQYERALDAGEFDEESEAFAAAGRRTAARLWSEA